VRPDILADRGVRTAAGFHRADAFGGQRLVADEKLAVFLRKNVVRHGRNVHPVAQFLAKRQHQRGFAAAHRPAHAHGECALAEVARQRLLAVMKTPWLIQRLMSVAARPVMM